MTYLSDGSRLFEVLAEDIRRNYGLGASLIREAALQDLQTGSRRLVCGERLAAYRAVTPA